MARRRAARQAGVMSELSRPLSGRVIAGVCAGIARRFGWSPTGVRIAFIVSCLLPGPQFVVYLILWALIPVEGAAPARLR